MLAGPVLVTMATEAKVETGRVREPSRDRASVRPDWTQIEMGGVGWAMMSHAHRFPDGRDLHPGRLQEANTDTMDVCLRWGSAGLQVLRQGSLAIRGFLARPLVICDASSAATKDALQRGNTAHMAQQLADKRHQCQLDR